MKSLSSVGLGLSLVFGCLLLALVAELYYLFWWKKRITNGGLQEDSYNSTAREFFRKSCWKKPSSLSSQDLFSPDTQVHEPRAQVHGNSDKDFCHKPFGEGGVDDELVRMQNFAGPPRFLFTIKEETKEDLESADGRSRGDRSRKGSRSRSLSDLFHIVETPYLTPIASPPYFTPPLTPAKSSHGSLFGSAGEAEFTWLRSSPPPNFQFLRDADDKLYRRKFTEEVELERGIHRNEVPSTSTIFHKDEENGSFITLIVANNREEELDNDHHYQNALQYTPNSSRVLPLASSPPTSSKLTSNSKSITHKNLHQ